jgi:hypothetical protein
MGRDDREGPHEAPPQRKEGRRMNVTARPGYRSTEVVDACPGVTYRQLDYWCRCGILGPDHATNLGSGKRRTFTPSDVAVVKAIGLVAGELDHVGVRRNPLGTDIYKLVALQVRDGADRVVVRLGDRVRIVVDLTKQP